MEAKSTLILDTLYSELGIVRGSRKEEYKGIYWGVIGLLKELGYTCKRDDYGKHTVYLDN